MSRPWLAAGAVLAVLLGTWLGVGRLDDVRSATTTTTPAPTESPAGPSSPPTSPPSSPTPTFAPSDTPPAVTASATTSATSATTRPDWYPLELDDEPALFLVTGGLPADDAVFKAGHEPNGPFWDGVAEWLIQTRLRRLTGRVEFNSEAGMFCAYGDRSALEELGTAMAKIATNPNRARTLIAKAEAAGFTFDD